MNKKSSATDPYSLTDSTYGLKLTGPGIIDIYPGILKKYVVQDHGLDHSKRNSLLTFLNTPEAFDHLLAGAAGAAIAKAASSYANLSKPAQTLLSLAGFGLGNIIYNSLAEQKFATYDPETGKSKIKL
jgi:hypothetical protein